MWDIMGNICERVQDNLWGIYRKYLWEPKLGNNMEDIWIICGSMQEIFMWAQNSLWACRVFFSEWVNEIRVRLNRLQTNFGNQFPENGAFGCDGKYYFPEMDFLLTEI